MIESKFKGRTVVEKPACPFCGNLLAKPIETRSSQMPMGSCTCGAAYICDVTGHNLGSALVDALLLASDGNSEKAWDLMPDEDYSERQLKNYDLVTHQIIHGGAYQGRRIAGTLLFIRLTGSPGEKDRADGPADQDRKGALLPDAPDAAARALSKQEVESLVGSYDLGPLLASAAKDKRILRNLRRLLYSPDELLRRRAAEALGRVSEKVFSKDPGAVSRLLQELFTSVTDTAASTWGAIDAIGEIIRFLPDAFSSYIPRLAQLSRDRSLLEDVLRALVSIAHTKPESMKINADQLIPFLEDHEPRIQGYTAILVGRLRCARGKDELERLCASDAEMTIYEDGDMHKKTVGRLAGEALERL